MKILMLVNWKVEFCEAAPANKQPPDYYTDGNSYWFFKYFKEPVQVDVIDISSFPLLEKIESKKLKFYIWQALRAIPKLNQYDYVLSHGAQSGVMLSLWRRLFKGKAKHILFDIGSFNSAAESGGALKLMQFASKSLNGMIYHTSNQKKYYEKCFPWLVEKARFIPFGTDSVFFDFAEEPACEEKSIVCVGYKKRDWDTLIAAYQKFAKEAEGKEIPFLHLIGSDDSGVSKDVELPKGAKIVTTPYIPIDELILQIRKALFCVLPLEEFNYSYGQMTLLQQMALGKAVITSAVSGVIDYVRDGQNALCYQTGNVEELREKMTLLYQDEALRKTLGAQAAEYVKHAYNEEKMALKIEEYLKELA